MIDTEILRHALLVANEIIGFKRHRMYFCWPGRNGPEKVWHYRVGFFPDSVLRRELEDCRALHSQLVRSCKPTVVTDYDSRRACLAALHLPGDVLGCLGIMREDDFCEDEQWRLKLVAQLTEAALLNPDVADLLFRLNLMFLNRRTLMRMSSSQEILKEYLQKAGCLAHPESFYPLVVQKRGNPVVRTAAKLITPNETALYFDAWHSTAARAEWTRKRRATRYILARDDSIAARVYKSCRPYMTNNYLEEENVVRLFADTKSHISAPIFANISFSQGGLSVPACLGVLSIETTKPNAYDENTLAAVTLMAAHAAWPLSRSLIREEADRKQQEAKTVSVTTERLRECTRWDDVVKTLAEGLQELKYDRGLLSQVDYEKGAVIGRASWGGKKMREVQGITKRDLQEDARDCQVIAVKTREPVIIHDPDSDMRADRVAKEIGDLRPFGIFPLVDAHGQVMWTVHVERRDLAPIGEADRVLVEELCAGAMKSWEHIRHTDFEAEWMKTFVRSTFTSLDEVLREFADFVTSPSRGIVARCRVFRIDADKQIGHIQAGSSTVPSFRGRELTAESLPILRTLRKKRKPLLVVKAARHRRHSSCVEFAVEVSSRDPHEREFSKAGGSRVGGSTHSG